MFRSSGLTGLPWFFKPPQTVGTGLVVFLHSVKNHKPTTGVQTKPHEAGASRHARTRGRTCVEAITKEQPAMSQRVNAKHRHVPTGIDTPGPWTGVLRGPSAKAGNRKEAA
jgi:hypothetical protein